MKKAPFLTALAVSAALHSVPLVVSRSVSPIPGIVDKQIERVDHVFGWDEAEIDWRAKLASDYEDNESNLELNQLFEDIQRHTMRIPEDSLEFRKLEIEQIAEGISLLKKRGFTKKEIFTLTLQLQGEYSSSQASSAYLLEGRTIVGDEGANCYGRFDLLASALILAYPEDIDHMKLDVVMTEKEDGTLTPHIRLLVNAEAFEVYVAEGSEHWYVIEGETLRTTTIPPSHTTDIRKALVGLVLGKDTPEDSIKGDFKLRNLWNLGPAVYPTRVIKSSRKDSTPVTGSMEPIMGKLNKTISPEANEDIGLDNEIVEQIISSTCPEDMLTAPLRGESAKSWFKRELMPKSVPRQNQDDAFRVLWIVEGEEERLDPNAVASSMINGIEGGYTPESGYAYYNVIPPSLSAEEFGAILDRLNAYHLATANTYEWGPFSGPESEWGSSTPVSRYDLAITNMAQLTDENIDKIGQLQWPLKGEEAAWWETTLPRVMIVNHFESQEQASKLWWHSVPWTVETGFSDEWMNWANERGRGGLIQTTTGTKGARDIRFEIQNLPNGTILENGTRWSTSNGSMYVDGDCRDEKAIRGTE
jgi:hypothetical protein